MSPSSSAARRPIVLVALVLAGVVVVGLAITWRESGAGRAAVPDKAPSEPAGEVLVPNDRTVKADLLEKLERPPQVLIFGGSRATRFEPSYLERLTGLRGFNLALQNGRPEDAWAFVNRAHIDHPKTRLHVVWFIHVEAFRAQGLTFGLIQDERLSQFFPAALIAREREKVPRTEAEIPDRKDLNLTTYGADGVVLRNRYDIRLENGYTLDRGLEWSVNKAVERYATTTPALDPRSTKYFEKTLRLLDRLGAKPAIVLMPLHPTLLAAVRPAGWETRHREVLDYLEGLQKRYDFVTLDLSRLDSVDGDPDAFYDGFHITGSNARRVLDTVVRRAPACFE